MRHEPFFLLAFYTEGLGELQLFREIIQGLESVEMRAEKTHLEKIKDSGMDNDTKGYLSGSDMCV